MPADYERCIRNGGKVRTVSGPNKEHGLEKGEYVTYCILNGKSYRGEVKKKKVKSSDYKIKKIFNLYDLGDTFANKKNTSEIEVLTEGYWEHELYGTIEITPEDIDKFVENFNNKTRRIDIAVDQEHKPDLGAAGWFRELKHVVEDGIHKLKATIEWTKNGIDMLKNGIYKYFSPEFDFEYEDPETHETFENVLLGGALTNRPYFKSLAPVQLSENVFAEVVSNLDEKGGEKQMDEQELNANPEEEIEESEEESPVEPEEELAEDEEEGEEEAPEEAEEPEEEAEEEPEAEEEEPAEESEEEPAEEPAEPVEASEKPNAKEFNDLKSELGVLKKKLRFSEVREEIQGYTFSESNPNGRLLPKSSKAAQGLLMSLNARQSKLFKEFINSLPIISSVLFEETGSGENGESTKASEQLTKEANILSEKEGITFGEALKRVSADNPGLAKKAQEEVN